jgi:hypothetical protein
LRVPHEIDTQKDAEFDEKLVHLANISGISMRVEKGGGGHGEPNINSHDLSATACWKPENLRLKVLAVRERVKDQKASSFIRN